MPKRKSNLRQQTLDTAAEAVNKNRNANYGEPEDNFARIARLWNVHLINRGIIPDATGPVLTLADVAMMQALLKIARLSETEDHFDSWADLAGYAACGAEVSQQ